MRSAFIVCFATILLLSCNDSGKSKSGAGNNSSKKLNLDPYPADKLTEIKKVCTSVDLISLKKEVNVSMSFDNPQSVAIILSFITDGKGEVTDLCAPDAHLICQNKGDVIQEIDLYYKNNCNAWIFLGKDGTPMGSNIMSNEGIDFFTNFLKPKSTQDTMGRKPQ